MSNIITPISLWRDFDASLDVMPVSLGEKTEGGIKYEYINFSGRDTGMGRVTVYGILASSETAPSNVGIILIFESNDGLDESLLAFFVKHGYTALAVDYAGRREGVERYTRYPQNVAYANLSTCGRCKDFVDDNAYKTCWYEWVGVGIYARKFMLERLNSLNIGLIGIRDGGELVWKLACAAQFSCAVTVAACGWKAYRGYEKFLGKEPEFDDERYRFVAGIDSQSYAPHVKCPMLMLCTTDDARFDYDRAYDTFSRINPKYARASVITYSLRSGARIDSYSTHDMFLFLDSYVKERHVFMPKPAEVDIYVDEKNNLVARVSYDHMGIIESSGVYFAEDSFNSADRDWTAATFKQSISEYESEYLLNIYEKTGMIFVLCYVVYSNGFTVWSKLAVKKLSGKFRNSRSKCKIMYANQFGYDCFTIANCDKYAIGGIFLEDDFFMPKMVVANGLKGIYSECGLTTNRLICPQYAPDKESIMKFDVCPERDMTIDLVLKNVVNGEKYISRIFALGGVWQSVIQKAKVFKNKEGISLNNFTECVSLTVTSEGKYAVNNLIWL